MGGLLDGVEVIDDDLAPFVVKAMEAKWAAELLRTGVIRLGSLPYYRGLEHDDLGDKWEGIGSRNVNGMPVEVTDANDVFVLCASTPTDHEQLLRLDEDYDTIVRIADPAGFARAIVDAAHEAGVELFAQIGVCRYHRGAGSDGPGETVWASSWNVFEKEPKYSHQCEFRFAFFRYGTTGDSMPERLGAPEVDREKFLYVTIKDPTRYLSTPPGAIPTFG